MKNKLKKVFTLILVVALGLTTLAGCGKSDGKGNGSTIVVGSKGFTESYLLAELYALALEDAGYEVDRKYDIASLHEFLDTSEVDIYPEYTATIILNYLDGEIPETNEEIYEKTKNGEAEQYNNAVLEQTDVNDKTCLVILKSKADELGITNISDLQKHADGFKLANFYGWTDRVDNLPKLEELYGEFGFEIVDIDAGLKYTALEQGEVDVIPGNTTEAQLLDTDKYLVLEEDIPVWADYYVVPLARQEYLDEHPDVEEIINNVGAHLDTATMQKLIKAVDVDGEEFEDVAADFYEKNIKK